MRRAQLARSAPAAELLLERARGAAQRDARVLRIRDAMEDLFRRFHPSQLVEAPRLWRKHVAARTEHELCARLAAKFRGRSQGFFDWDDLLSIRREDDDEERVCVDAVVPGIESLPCTG